MPPRTRKSTPDSDLPGVEDPAGDAPEILMEEQPPGCPTCFPAGWPDGAFAVGCEHGSWQREAATD